MKLHTYDWSALIIILLLFSTGFFAYKTFSLSKKIDAELNRENVAKAEYEARTSHYREVSNVAIKRALYFERLYKQPKKVNVVYKKIYEKILTTPDTLQYAITDSILTECRIKPFAGNQLLFE